MESKSVRGSLMPSRLQQNKLKRPMQPMVGSLQPYRVKYKSLKPNFKIEAETFRLLPQNDVLQRYGDNYDPNHLSIQRLKETLNTAKASRLDTHHGRNNDLFSHLLSVPDDSSGNKRAATISRKDFAGGKSVTMDNYEVRFKGDSAQ